MELPPVALSQNHLSLLETCPRKFQYIFEQALAVPAQPAGQTAALWGNQFHLVMQQLALGLPMDRILATNPEMAARVHALQQQAPDLFQAIPQETLRQSEHQRTLALNGYVLTVVYDLVVLSPQQGVIIDWKTYLCPPAQHHLARDWQTRLYLYVLTETTALQPEQLTMVYWFVRNRDLQGHELPPSAYRFTYSQLQHERTRADLMRLTDDLSNLRCGDAFPKTHLQESCGRCPFQVRCQRQTAPDLPLDLDAIAETRL